MQNPHVCLHPEDNAEEIDAKILRFLKFPTSPVNPSDWFLNQFSAIEQTRVLVRLAASLAE